MSVTLELPEDVERKLFRLADRYGSPDEAVAALVRQTPLPADASVSDELVAAAPAEDAGRPGKNPETMTYEEWKRGFDELLAMAEDRGTDVSYDRADWYPDPMR